MILYIKNMTTPRCIYFVKQELEKLGIMYEEVKMGEVVLKNDIKIDTYNKLESILNSYDLFIMQDKRIILSEKIKKLIVEMVSSIDDNFPKENYSWYISKKLSYNYTYLANLFSEAEGITIEHFIISTKIEKAKQLLIQENLSLTEIADTLHYSSVAHLSGQFKKVTGKTASQYKMLYQKKV